jgi:hypothetical protein
MEQVTSQLRLIMRLVFAFAFHSYDALFALAMRALGGTCPWLFGR